MQAIGQSSAAQAGTGAKSPAPCTTPVALGALLLGPIPSVGAPYSATVITTRDQTLANGSVVHGSVTTYQARDAVGRTWEKRSLGCQSGEDGERHPVVQILVYDPGTQTTISWKVDDPARVYRSVHTAPVRPSPAKTDEQSEAAARSAMEQMGIHTEDLGSKTIAGVVADGTRTVQTVPAGQAGNNQPIKIVDETWIAKDLNLEVLRVDDNSRTGRVVTEVVGLKQDEPDPALFAPPAGYSHADANPSR
jgi:hypothetical protein